MENLYVVATGQHVGKTTISLGLMHGLASRGYKVHFFKPVGQEYVEKDGIRVYKDAVLVQAALLPEGSLVELSPVTVPKGFVEEYVFHRDMEPLKKRIMEAYGRLCGDCDVIVVEGTGHAGVGSCFDLSNAEVAALLHGKVVLVVEGGIGRSLDEVALSIGLFREKKVKVVGIVANKVWADKRERIAAALKQGLANMGLRFLGAIPYDPVLTYPDVRQVAEVISAKVLCGEAKLSTHVEHFLVAAMEPEHVLPWIRPHSMMITPGDRIDNILLAMNCGERPDLMCPGVVAIALTGGLMPDRIILSLMKSSGVPVLFCDEDTYTVSSKVQRTVFKMQPDDEEKIHHAERLVGEYVDLAPIIDEVGSPRGGKSNSTCGSGR